MNIDDKIIKLLNQYDHDSNMFTVDLVSQIKQSILKAIMEKIPNKVDIYERQKELDPNEIDINMTMAGWNERNIALEDFESVIKEILGDSKDNKI